MDIINLFIAHPPGNTILLNTTVPENDQVPGLSGSKIDYLAYVLMGAIVSLFESKTIFGIMDSDRASLHFLQQDIDSDIMPTLVLSYEKTSSNINTVIFIKLDSIRKNFNDELKTFLWHQFGNRTDLSIYVRSIQVFASNESIFCNIYDTFYRSPLTPVVANVSNVMYLNASKYEENYVTDFRGTLAVGKFSINTVVMNLKKDVILVCLSFQKLLQLEIGSLSFSALNLQAYMAGTLSVGTPIELEMSNFEHSMNGIIKFNFLHEFKTSKSFLPVHITFDKVNDQEIESTYKNTAIKWVIIGRIRSTTINDTPTVGITFRKININHGMLDRITEDTLLEGAPNKTIDMNKYVGKYKLQEPRETVGLLLGDLLRQEEYTENHWSIFVTDSTIMFIKEIKHWTINLCFTQAGSLEVRSVKNTKSTLRSTYNKRLIPCETSSHHDRRFYDHLTVKQFKEEIEKSRSTSFDNLFRTLISIGNRILKSPEYYNVTTFLQGYMLLDCDKLRLITGNRIICDLGDKDGQKLDISFKETSTSEKDKCSLGSVQFQNFLTALGGQKTIAAILTQKNSPQFDVLTMETNTETSMKQENCFKETQIHENINIYMKNLLKCTKTVGNLETDKDLMTISGEKIFLNSDGHVRLNLKNSTPNFDIETQYESMKAIDCYETFVINNLKRGLLLNLNPEIHFELLKKRIRIDPDSGLIGLKITDYAACLVMFLSAPLLYKLAQTWFLLPKRILWHVLEKENVDEDEPTCVLAGAHFSKHLSSVYDEFIVLKPQFLTVDPPKAANLNEFVHVSVQKVVEVNIFHQQLTPILKVKFEDDMESPLKIHIEQQRPSILQFSDGYLIADTCGTILLNVQIRTCSKMAHIAKFIDLYERLGIPAIINCENRKVFVPNLHSTSENAIVQLPALNNSIYNGSGHADILVSVDFPAKKSKAPYSYSLVPSKTRKTIVHFDFPQNTVNMTDHRVYSIEGSSLIRIFFAFDHKHQQIRFEFSAPAKAHKNLLFVHYTSHRIEHIPDNGTFQLVPNPIFVPDWLEILIVDSSLVGSQMILMKSCLSCNFYRFFHTFIVSNSIEVSLPVPESPITIIFPKTSLEMKRVDPTVLKFDDKKVEIRKPKWDDDFVDITVLSDE